MLGLNASVCVVYLRVALFNSNNANPSHKEHKTQSHLLNHITLTPLLCIYKHYIKNLLSFTQYNTLECNCEQISGFLRVY